MNHKGATRGITKEDRPDHYWNYRVIAYTDQLGETSHAIHEVHYEGDNPVMVTTEPADVSWNPECDNPRVIFANMMKALDKDVLLMSIFEPTKE